MQYREERINEVLAQGEIEGFEFKIKNYGTHPCSYVRIPKDHILDGVDYDNIYLDCHGGLTYSSREDDGYWWIGWDYGHCDDFTGYYMKYSNQDDQGKKLTTDKLVEEMKQFITQELMNVKKKDD